MNAATQKIRQALTSLEQADIHSTALCHSIVFFSNSLQAQDPPSVYAQPVYQASCSKCFCLALIPVVIFDPDAVTLQINMGGSMVGSL